MSAHLLDANVLIALTVAEHEHHELSSEWLTEVERFAVCPITEGALIRFLLRMGEPVSTALAVLTGVHSHPHCEFWPDAASYADIDLTAVRGHRQATDAYLVGLAESRGARLATLDRALASQYPVGAELVTD